MLHAQKCPIMHEFIREKQVENISFMFWGNSFETILSASFDLDMHNNLQYE